jgi:hypothetical protein
MNERLKQLAEQAGFDEATSYLYHCRHEQIERFAELVRQDEREACAKLCELQWKQQALRHYASLTYSQSANNCATAIRARGKK